MSNPTHNRPVAGRKPAPTAAVSAVVAAASKSTPAPPPGGTEIEFTKPKPKPVVATLNTVLGKGLDIGTMFIVGAQQISDHVRFTSVRDAFFTLEYTDLVGEMMIKTGADHVRRGDDIVIIGDKSIEFANMFRAELRRPLQDGVISPKERNAFGIIELILERAVGNASVPGETCYYSIPAAAIDKEESNLVFHEGMFGKFVENLGYTPKSLNEAEAIAYSELSNPEDNLTGLALSFGAGMVNACFIYLGVPYLRFAVARGGDWIDKKSAAASNSKVAKITQIKESGNIDISATDGWEQNAIAMHYATLIKYVVLNLHNKLGEESLPEQKDSIKVVISGGTSKIRGFRQMFEGEFGKLQWPFTVSSFVMAKDPMTAVANGCLTAALLAEKKKG